MEKLCLVPLSIHLLPKARASPAPPMSAFRVSWGPSTLLQITEIRRVFGRHQAGGQKEVFLINIGKAVIRVWFMACARHLYVPCSKTGRQFTQGVKPDVCSQDLKCLGKFAFLGPFLVS